MFRHLKMEFKAAEQFQMSPSSKDAGNAAAPSAPQSTSLIFNHAFK